ncbi:MAG: EamA family transporter [Mycobacteriales bacterium]
MTALLLGLASAVSFGAADFLAGLLSRRAHFALVGLVSQVSAATCACAALPWFGGAGPSAMALGWGAASGLGGGVGSLALYRGLGHGQMSIVAPLSAVGGAGLPALAGLALGERPSLLAVLGILLALPAVWLVARPAGRTGASASTEVTDGLLAGAGFALLFIALDRAGDRSGLWPVAAGQLASLAVLTGFVLTRRPARTRHRAGAGARIGAAVLVGAISVGATLLYFLATHAGLLAVVAVLTSLYPAVTIVLAILVLHERATRVQRVGLTLAVAAVTMITIA